jgi:hypothetical protein
METIPEIGTVVPDGSIHKSEYSLFSTSDVYVFGNESV